MTKQEKQLRKEMGEMRQNLAIARTQLEELQDEHAKCLTIIERYNHPERCRYRGKNHYHQPFCIKPNLNL